MSKYSIPEQFCSRGRQHCFSVFVDVPLGRLCVGLQDRVEGARYLVSKLRKVPSLSSILPQMEKLMNAYIELAYLSPPVQEPGQPAISTYSSAHRTLFAIFGSCCS